MSLHCFNSGRASGVEDVRTREQTFSWFIAADEIGTVCRSPVREPVVALIPVTDARDGITYLVIEDAINAGRSAGRYRCLWCCRAHDQPDCNCTRWHAVPGLAGLSS